MTWRIGVDIGGTFTDVVLADEATGAVDVVKVPTTPRDFAGAWWPACVRRRPRTGWPPVTSAGWRMRPPW